MARCRAWLPVPEASCRLRAVLWPPCCQEKASDRKRNCKCLWEWRGQDSCHTLYIPFGWILEIEIPTNLTFFKKLMKHGNIYMWVCSWQGDIIKWHCAFHCKLFESICYPSLTCFLVHQIFKEHLCVSGLPFSPFCPVLFFFYFIWWY